jgi:hypothetical protein
MVCLRNISVDTLHKGDTEDNNNNNGLVEVIHQKLVEAAELTEDKSLYYKYTPANVLENNNFKLYWNCSILTDKTILLTGLT